MNSLKALYSEGEVLSMFFMLLEHNGIDKIGYIKDPELVVQKKDEDFYLNSLQKLENHVPIQYILGYAWFLESKYKVDEKVLIPRSETEELVHWVLEHIKSDEKILDIGTGSGCIPISLKKLRPHCEVHACDISEGALQLAKANANEILGESGVHFEQCNILESFPKFKPTLIVSNPPYVTQEDKLQMEDNVLKFEPHLALFSETPLQFYTCIADHALSNLEDDGLLFFEINESYGDEVVSLLIARGFKDVVLKEDLNGKSRFVKAKKNM